MLRIGEIKNRVNAIFKEMFPEDTKLKFFECDPKTRLITFDADYMLLKAGIAYNPFRRVEVVEKSYRELIEYYDPKLFKFLERNDFSFEIRYGQQIEEPKRWRTK